MSVRRSPSNCLQASPVDFAQDLSLDERARLKGGLRNGGKGRTRSESVAWQKRRPHSSMLPPEATPAWPDGLHEGEERVGEPPSGSKPGCALAVAIAGRAPPKSEDGLRPTLDD